MLIANVVPPLILTLRFDPARQAKFDALRKAHFPPDLNHLASHVTLFHQLPDDAMPEIVDLLRDVAATFHKLPVTVESVFSLGRGVAFRLSSAEVLALRSILATEWRPYLTPQDLNFGRLHVTVRNKVTAAAARGLLRQLQDGFVPECFVAPGLDLWRYLGGPWEHVAPFDFLPGQLAPGGHRDEADGRVRWARSRSRSSNKSDWSLLCQSDASKRIAAV